MRISNATRNAMLDKLVGTNLAADPSPNLDSELEEAREIERLRGVPTDDDLDKLQFRNSIRATVKRAEMGRLWCCHPVNRVEREPERRDIPRFLLKNR